MSDGRESSHRDSHVLAVISISSPPFAASVLF
jgi:hypothetical protein